MKIIVQENNRMRYLLTVKDEKAIVFSEEKLKMLGIDPYQFESMSPAKLSEIFVRNFDFDKIVANAPDVDIFDVEKFNIDSSRFDYHVLEAEIDPCGNKQLANITYHVYF